MLLWNTIILLNLWAALPGGVESPVSPDPKDILRDWHPRTMEAILKPICHHFWFVTRCFFLLEVASRLQHLIFHWYEVSPIYAKKIFPISLLPIQTSHLHSPSPKLILFPPSLERIIGRIQRSLLFVWVGRVFINTDLFFLIFCFLLLCCNGLPLPRHSWKYCFGSFWKNKIVYIQRFLE